MGRFFGAADRNRTGTDFTPRDFKSLVSTYSTTAAYSVKYIISFSGSYVKKIEGYSRKNKNIYKRY